MQGRRRARAAQLEVEDQVMRERRQLKVVRERQAEAVGFLQGRSIRRLGFRIGG